MTAKLIIKNIPFRTKAAVIYELHADIAKVEMKHGFAFVTVEGNGENVISELNGSSIGDKEIVVEKYVEKENTRGADMGAPNNDRRGRSRTRGNQGGQPNDSRFSQHSQHSQQEGSSQGRDFERSRSRSRSRPRPAGPRAHLIRGEEVVFRFRDTETLMWSLGYTSTKAEVAETESEENEEGKNTFTHKTKLVDSYTFDPKIESLKSEEYTEVAVNVLRKRIYAYVSKGDLYARNQKARESAENIIKIVKGSRLDIEGLVFIRLSGESFFQSSSPILSILGNFVNENRKPVGIKSVHQLRTPAKDLILFEFSSWGSKEVSESDE